MQVKLDNIATRYFFKIFTIFSYLILFSLSFTILNSLHKSAAIPRVSKLTSLISVKADADNPDDGIIDFGFVPSSGYYNYGDTFTVDVTIKAEGSDQNLSAIGLNIIYDSSILELTDYTINSANTDTLNWDSSPSEGTLAGDLKYFKISAGISDPNTPFSVSASTATTLLQLTFKGIASGSGVVYFSYSDSRTSYDGYTSATLYSGSTDDVSDHSFFDNGSPAEYTINSSSNYVPSTGVLDWPIVGIFLVIVGIVFFKFKMPLKFKDWKTCIYK